MGLKFISCAPHILKALVLIISPLADFDMVLVLLHILRLLVTGLKQSQLEIHRLMCSSLIPLNYRELIPAFFGGGLIPHGLGS